MITLNQFSDRTYWNEYELKDYCDFAEAVSEFHMGEDAFSGYGEWFYVEEDHEANGERFHIIYGGSWGNDNSPGASMYTWAEVYDALDADDECDFRRRVEELEQKQQWLDNDEGGEDDEEDDYELCNEHDDYDDCEGE